MAEVGFELGMSKMDNLLSGCLPDIKLSG